MREPVYVLELRRELTRARRLARLAIAVAVAVVLGVAFFIAYDHDPDIGNNGLAARPVDTIHVGGPHVGAR